jgi:hypothetical protein
MTHTSSAISAISTVSINNTILQAPITSTSPLLSLQVVIRENDELHLCLSAWRGNLYELSEEERQA